MSSYNYRSNQRTNTNRNNQRGGRFAPRNNRRMGQYIDPSRFVKAAKPVETAEYIAKHKFSDFAVDDLIKRNVAAKGYITPTPIQDQTIPMALEGKDIIGIASTGTGKTAAFALPMLTKLIRDKNSRALIIAPTRELAQQIEDECRSLAKGSGLSGALLIGGTPMGPQLRDLSSNPNIVVGTPGRIKDHIERRTLKIAGFNMVVLDEVDRMLDMGFIDDVRQILSGLSPVRQSLFFSATMDGKVKSLIESFSKEPVMISLKTGEASENVNQDVVRYSGDTEKLEKLHDILLNQQVEKSIIFSETQRSVEKLSNMLIERGFKADAIHGGKSQGQRQRALNRFKSNEIKILVATDVAARGIDVVDITHVINFSQPQSYEDYIHRIGRAGRAGRIGHALTFVN
ncbi:MAG TPA: DEAD/DEAH box helicase [Candidatus Saccharimonadales bacterium]